MSLPHFESVQLRLRGEELDALDANRLIGPQITGSELIIFERAGHSLIWRRPDELIRVTEEFLAA